MLTFKATASNAPTAIFRCADGRELYLHSRFDPKEEGCFLVRDLAVQERTLYVVLGFGLGYHVEALLDRIPPTAHVVVVEPSTGQLSACPAEYQLPGRQWIHDARLHFQAHHDPKLTPLHLADRMAALRMLAVKMFTHIPSMMTDEAFYRGVSSEIQSTFPLSMQRHLSGLDATLENDLRNFWANLAHSWNAAPITNLRGQWSGRPLIIVSSGPSLTTALPALARLRGKALVLATGSAVKPLLQASIQPDLVISVDPYENNAAHFQGWDTGDVPLVYYHRIHRHALKSYAGPTCVFVMHDEPALPFSRDDEQPSFQRGGSVAFSALQLAHYLGASPVVFVGQDFAFAEGRTHAEGALYEDAATRTTLSPEMMEVPAINGQRVVTSRLLHGYLLHMQDYLLSVAGRWPDIRHINVSRTGARIRGMEHLSLDEALASYPPAVGSARELLRKAPRHHDPQATDLWRQSLTRWATEVGRLVSDLDDGESFEAAFARFKSTDLHNLAARSYDDLYYVYETRYQGGRSRESAGFARRFANHLRTVAEEIDRMRAAQ